MRKRAVSVAGLILAVICAGLAAGYPSRAQQTQLPNNPVYDEETDTTDWDYVYFGEYPQTELEEDELTPEIIAAEYNVRGDAVIDGQKYRRVRQKGGNYSSDVTVEGFYDWSEKTYAYFKYEPLRWRVLQADSESLFLMADVVLDCRKYNTDDSAVTWSVCSVRNWLNGYGAFEESGTSFLDNAFTAEEQDSILTTHVKDSDNLLHKTGGGADTQDKIFFMSIREMLNPEYGFSSDYMCYSSTRMLQPTDYARAMGVWMSTENEQYGDYCWWMLRSPGSHTKAVSLVYRFGHVYQDGYYADTPYYGVCPALRISTASTEWTQVSPAAVKENICSDSVRHSMGDADGDGAVTLADAQEVLKMALHITDGTGCEEWCDVDGDGVITLTDAQHILKYALKLIDCFPGDYTSEPPLQVSDVPSMEPPVLQTGEPKPSASTGTVTIPTVPPAASYAPVPSEGPLEQKDYDASGRIWIAADSIAASYHSTETMGLCGWGEVLGEYFNQNVTVYNKAVGGRSSKSFIQENNYKDIMKGMQAGDYLLISFGHNDERAAVELYTDPFGTSDTVRSFKWYLKQYYIDPAIRAGVQPVLISPVARRYFYQGVFVNPQLHTPYMRAMEELAEEYADQGMKVYYVNLHRHMLDLYEQLGEEGTYSLHAKNDTTHLCRKGIDIVCDYLVQEMKSQNMNLAVFLKNK